MQAYADDSASADPPILVYAAYIASPANWAALSEEWETFRLAPPRINYFKMQEAFSRTKEFRRGNFSKEERDAKVEGFGRIIRSYVKGASVNALHLSTFDRIVVKRQGIPHSFTNKHFFLMYNLMHDVLRFAEHLHLSWPISFVFDSQSRGKGQFLDAWNSFVRGAPIEKNRFGASPIFGDDRKFPPLQAADLLAWTFRRHLVSSRQRIQEFPWMRDECSPLLGIKRTERVWKPDNLELWVRHSLNASDREGSLR